MSYFNAAADLHENIRVYSDYYESRSSVASLRKIDVPMVPALYAEDERMRDPLVPYMQREPEHTDSIQAQVLPEESVSFAQEGYHQPQLGEWELYGLVNYRLKGQARRYPHPITNEMEIIT